MTTAETPGPVKVGIIGCGNICDIYFKAGQTFKMIEIVACADLLRDRAKAKAREHGIAKVLTPEKLTTDGDLELVINLTVPVAHADVAIQAIQGGKHVYNEKPLGVTREEAHHLLQFAKEKNVRLGCAPDTFLGASLQTCRKIVDDGWIGTPIAATAFMMHHGHESWHPNPDFFYKPGGGPMLDMGPYYLTALVNLMGPIKRVSASTRATFKERRITSEDRYGQIVKVETPTHLAGTLEFANGAIGTMVTSFDVWAHTAPHLEIHGTEGSLQVPDPNNFDGVVRVFRKGQEGWRDMPYSHGYAENTRGIGVADMAHAMRSDRPHRASGEMAYHVLDVMQAFDESSHSGEHIRIHSTCDRPAPLPLGLTPGELDT